MLFSNGIGTSFDIIAALAALDIPFLMGQKLLCHMVVVCERYAMGFGRG
jgi:hypothetical protein